MDDIRYISVRMKEIGEETVWRSSQSSSLKSLFNLRWGMGEEGVDWRSIEEAD